MRYSRRRISESCRSRRSSLTESQVIRKIARIIAEAEEDQDENKEVIKFGLREFYIEYNELGKDNGKGMKEIFGHRKGVQNYTNKQIWTLITEKALANLEDKFAEEYWHSEGDKEKYVPVFPTFQEAYNLISDSFSDLACAYVREDFDDDKENRRSPW